MSWLTWKLVRRVVLVFLLILVAFYLVTLFRVWRAADQDDRARTQAIIVLGAAQYDGPPTAAIMSASSEPFTHHQHRSSAGEGPLAGDLGALG